MEMLSLGILTMRFHLPDPTSESRSSLTIVKGEEACKTIISHCINLSPSAFSKLTT